MACQHAAHVKAHRAHVKAALARIGGLSNPAKMPSFGYSLPATECNVGSLLAKVDGTTCSDCYALKGRYIMPCVRHAMERRLRAIFSRPALRHVISETWVRDMITVLSDERTMSRSGNDPRFFRWHDSGDLQNLGHLRAIVAIAEALPTVRFWLPTREYKLIGLYKDQGGTFPSNLTVRVSVARIDQAPDALVRIGQPTSGVHSQSEAYGEACKAPSQGGECLDCRACWSPDVAHVSYAKH
jgi:hypothetical protein